MGSIGDFCYTRFSGLGQALLRLNTGITDAIDAANMRQDPIAYLSTVSLAVIITSVISAALILLFFAGFLPLMILSYALPSPMLLPLIITFMPLGALGIGIFYPSLKASSRVSGLKAEIPFAFMYISVMVSGGLDPYMALLRIRGIKLLPKLSEEMGRIQGIVLSEGVDPVSAMEKAAKSISLKEYKELLLGYASAVRTGGDVFHYLYQQTDNMFKKLATDVRAVSENLSMLMETFIIVSVLGALSFYMFFVISMSIGQGVGMGMSTESFFMFAFIILPMLSGVFLYLSDGSQSNFPCPNTKTYLIFAASMPIGILLAMLTVVPFFVPTQFPIPRFAVPLLTGIQTVLGMGPGTEPAIGLAISLSLMVLPAVIVDYRNVNSESSVLSGVTNFLRDMVETRKTGLSPERCIKSLADRNYGAFSKHLKLMNMRLSWGEPLSGIFKDFSEKIKSWLSLVNIYLLIDAIEVGGGKEESLETLAEFAEATRALESEKKKLLRPLLFVPYIGAVLLTATVIMLLQFFSGTPGTSMAMSMTELNRILLTPLILHSFMIGLVAGKVSSGRVSSGFKHGIFLAMASLIGIRMGAFMPALFSAA